MPFRSRRCAAAIGTAPASYGSTEALLIRPGWLGNWWGDLPSTGCGCGAHDGYGALKLPFNRRIPTLRSKDRFFIAPHKKRDAGGSSPSSPTILNKRQPLNGHYSFEVANPDGQLIYAGVLSFKDGIFKGIGFGHRFAGTYDVKEERLRAEGDVLQHGSDGQNTFSAFGQNDREFQVILVGVFEEDHVRGVVIRLDVPELIVPFRLTPKAS